MSDTLYQRLGEADGIARLVDDVIVAHLANPIVKSRFQQIEDMAKTKRVVTDFFCAGAGGPTPYAGKDMLAVHKGMNVSEQEYLAVMDDIVGAMEKHRYDEETKSDVIAILYSLKGDIIRQ